MITPYQCPASLWEIHSWLWVEAADFLGMRLGVRSCRSPPGEGSAGTIHTLISLGDELSQQVVSSVFILKDAGAEI